MLENISLQKILFLDIETVPAYPAYEEMPDKWQQLWDKKAKFFIEEGQIPSEVYERAGIYAEFGKIVCICAGIIAGEGSEKDFRLISFYGEDEKQILQDFCGLLHKSFNTTEHTLCAHNGKEFDFPYLCRRILINGMKIPSILDIAGRKPWEVQHLDTLQLWKFGDYKHYTSLDLLSSVFDIPSPKEDMDGSQVGSAFYKEKDYEKIARYCRNDVLAIAQLFLRYQNRELIDPKRVVLV